MSTFRFEYKDDKGNNCLQYASFSNEMDAWLSILPYCGWNNRTSLRTTNEKGYTISNWWDVSYKLPLLSHPSNKQSDYNFYKKKWNK